MSKTYLRCCKKTVEGLYTECPECNADLLALVGIDRQTPKPQANTLDELLISFAVTAWHKISTVHDKPLRESEEFNLAKQAIQALIQAEVAKAQLHIVRHITQGGRGGTEIFIENIPLENYKAELTKEKN